MTRHDQFTNQQLAELRGQLIEQDGKIVGLRTEMRQRFGQIDQRFGQQEVLLHRILDHLPPAQ